MLEEVSNCGNSSAEATAVEETNSADKFSAPIWVTVVHNDPVNLMNYVQWIFESYFSMSERCAYQKMMQVHRCGRAIVARGGREAMEKNAQDMHAYGIWATVEQEKNS